MPKIGDTVLFHFLHSSSHDDECENAAKCACIADAFVNRPAKVIAMYVDAGERQAAAIKSIDRALAKSDDDLMSDVDPTDINAETAADRRTRFAAARAELAVRAAELKADPTIDLDLDVALTQEDLDGLGCYRDGRPLTIGEYQEAGLTVHLRVRQSTDKKAPTAQTDSGTWTEA